MGGSEGQGCPAAAAARPARYRSAICWSLSPWPPGGSPCSRSYCSFSARYRRLSSLPFSTQKALCSGAIRRQSSPVRLIRSWLVAPGGSPARICSRISLLKKMYELRVGLGPEGWLENSRLPSGFTPTVAHSSSYRRRSSSPRSLNTFFSSSVRLRQISPVRLITSWLRKLPLVSTCRSARILSRISFEKKMYPVLGLRGPSSFSPPPFFPAGSARARGSTPITLHSSSYRERSPSAFTLKASFSCWVRLLQISPVRLITSWLRNPPGISTERSALILSRISAEKMM
mmetsp:Transcript_11953/g.18371  ORF Transcript_11953/g.18371 Transcript_11953/m.18371 type:complete len:287 (-) Transcript_11953:1330-2190(-)